MKAVGIGEALLLRGQCFSFLARQPAVVLDDARALFENVGINRL